MAIKDNPTDEVCRTRLIQAPALRKRLGRVSDMWLFRHKDELPTPMLIAGRRFWLEEEIDSFIEMLCGKRKPETNQRPGEES